MEDVDTSSRVTYEQTMMFLVLDHAGQFMWKFLLLKDVVWVGQIGGD